MQYTQNTLEPHWLPFTANRDFKADPRLMVKAEGVYYWDHRGRKILDGSSGLFCCALGHGRAEIADAVAVQLRELDYITHFQCAHPSSFELAGRIARLTPEPLNHVFFGNSGSEAVDTAMKIALAYFWAKGEAQRLRFVSRERAYHGVNMGGTALSGMVKNREVFGTGVPGVLHMRHTWDPSDPFHKGQAETGAELADDLDRFCAMVGGSTIAACFVEPIAGSTGVLVPPKGYLERLREICDAHGILLVFDEVITGFGRLGAPFAAQAFDVTPDIITMAKAVTNGAQPMGAVAVRDDIYETVVERAPDTAIELFHGYTFGAHPAACAAGLATLDIYEQEGVFENAAELSPYFLDRLFELQDLDDVIAIRGYGLMGAIDVRPGKAPGAHGLEVQKKLFHNGLHIKFTADAGLVAPPLVSTRAHIDELVGILRETLAGG